MAPEPATPPRSTKKQAQAQLSPEGTTTFMKESEDGVSPVRQRTQLRIRSVSVEDMEEMQEVLRGLPGVTPQKTPQSAKASRAGELKKKPQEAESPPDAGGIVGFLLSKGEALLAWAEPHAPMLTGHVELLVYSCDLGFRSMKWFQFGFTAVFLGFRLIIYSIILLPAFLQVAYQYFHDKRIRRRIPYYKNPRNYIDLYVPEEAIAAQEGRGEKVPVVIAVMGGAWVMGHRAWNAQLGLRLMDFGVLVVAVDYRNFPIAYVPEMVDDLNRAFSWVFCNIEAWGGDTNNVMLIGQSAGAHLSALLLLEHSLLEGKCLEGGQDQTDNPATRRQSGTTLLPDGWSTKDLKLFLGVSGPYDLVALEPHMNSRGIYHRILYALTGDGDLSGCSPTRVIKESDWRHFNHLAAPRVPPIYLFHGGKDKSVPAWSSKDFADTLKDFGVKNVKLDVRPTYTHTYPVIEGPMAGDDPQVELMLPVLFGAEKAKKMYKECPGKRMWPQLLIDIAKEIMPY